MTPLEEQVERALEAADELAAAIGSWREKGPPPQAKWDRLSDALASYLSARSFPLLPLEVTDGEARTKPYRCADCDQPHGPFNNIGSGQSNKPEVTYRLVCDRCWGPKPAALTQKGDNE